MNTRERFHATMNFEPVDRGIRWEMGYWAGAIRRWYREGLPMKKGVPQDLGDGRSMLAEALVADPETLNPIDAVKRDQDLHDYFEMDDPWWRLPLNTYVYPQYEPEILEDHGDVIIHRNEYGVIVQDRKDRMGFPHWMSTPVTTRDDWEKIKAERLQPKIEGRLPKNWQTIRAVYQNRTFPVVAGGFPCGFYGTARFLLGEEKVMLAFYDEPEMTRDIMNHLADLWVSLYDQLLDEIEVDALLIWEDMCYKGGPLISPAMFREFMLPGYQKVISCVKDHGVKQVMVDTDGFCSALLPLFIEGGVTILHPFEVASGMDVVEVRKAFPKLGIMAGLDKRKLAAGPQAIDAELDRKVPSLLPKGGYVPFVDHSVPPDISWQNFKYYRQKLNRMLDTNDY